ncbi:MAG: TonB family protein [Nitrospinae bacterium]|nr:TonB family protein [Nitrospinota bacterium]
MAGTAGNRWMEPDDGDGILPMVVFSIALHLSAMVGVVLYAKYFSHEVIRKAPDSYVVHLIDPGETPGAAGVGKSAIVDTAPPPEPEVKKAVHMEKKLLPLTKEQAREIKKIPVVKKVPEKFKEDAKETKNTKRLKRKTDAPKKSAEAVSKEARVKKGGGAVDIQKFPYEWYLRVMENKVYGNWDTLKENLFSDRAVKAVVSFVIGRQGNLAKLEIEESSYNADVDASALNAVRQSAPFPPLPPGYKDDSLDVHFGFTIEPQH